ncbi:MAG: TonB-dependent receptor plug domain-containing protein [Bacteroidia bacterium]
MKKRIFIAAAVIFSNQLHAQKDTTSKTLDEVVVTANKFPQKQNETGKVVTLITQDQLQKSFGKSLGEVLNQQPGLNINGADNNLGTNQTVYTRGASSANTLIMLDGVPLYDASGISNEFDLNNFALDNIERIEILKGSQSTLYGSDAVAGVINIISKKGEKKPFNLNADLSAGSYNTYKGGISLSGTNSKGQTYFISYNKIYSKGFSSAYDSTGKQNFDNDGFNQDVVQINYTIKPIRNTSVRFFGKYNNNHADIDAGAFADDKDYTYHNNNTIAGASVAYKINNGFIKLQYSYNRFNRNFIDDSTDVGGFSTYQKGRYNGTSNFAELYTNLHLNKHIELLAGADYRQNKTDQKYIYIPDYGFPSLPISGDSAHTNQFSGYASLFLKSFKGFNLDFGGRWNHHSIYGNNFTYSINPFYVINNHYKIYANVSSGYRVPSLYQLYSEYGNKNLKPEVTTSYEAGVQYYSENINARITGFARNGKDVFLFYTDPNTFASNYINGDKQHDYGIETEAAVHFTPAFSVALNYTYVDGKVTTKELPGLDTSFFNLYKRPKNILNLFLNYTVTNNIYLSTHLKTVSKAYEPQYMAAPYQLNAYYTLDLYSRYKFNNKYSIFTDLQNITDQK